MTTSEIISATITIVGSGGFLGGVYALLKLRPEAGQITVTAAQGAVIVQTGVITTLKTELDRVSHELEEERSINDTLRDRVRAVEKQLVELTEQISILTKN